MPILDEARRSAYNDAVAQASQVVTTRIRAESTIEASTDRASDSAKENIHAFTASRIEGLVVVDEYHEKTTRQVGALTERFYDI